MKTKKMNDTILLRLDKGDEVVASVLEVCRANDITAGYVTGIGAASSARVALLDPAQAQYVDETFTGPMEISSLVGNVGVMNGEPYAHLHINLADTRLQVVGGHLKSAVISITGELFLRILDGEIDHAFNPELGINQMIL